MAFLGLVLLLATWVALTGLQNISPWLLLGVLATVWLADSAAYFAGKRFGRHKLAPEISPGKTWEGVVGAMLAATIYGLALCHLLHYTRWLILGLWLIVVLSIMGDLFESLLKRQAGVKDSSHLLPGHGGVLDRIDGLIPTLPLVLFYIYFPLFSNLQLHARYVGRSPNAKCNDTWCDWHHRLADFRRYLAASRTLQSIRLSR
jgi:phosphatidate cytidylyltransferase